MLTIGMRVSAAAGLLSAYATGLYVCSCVCTYTHTYVCASVDFFHSNKNKMWKKRIESWNWCGCVKTGYRSAVSFSYTADRSGWKSYFEREVCKRWQLIHKTKKLSASKWQSGQKQKNTFNKREKQIFRRKSGRYHQQQQTRHAFILLLAGDFLIGSLWKSKNILRLSFECVPLCKSYIIY